MDEITKFNEVEYIVSSSIQKFQGIKIFQQTPCEGRFIFDDSADLDDLPANKLFALFTADIIKEEVIFTR
ncbi:MAG: hypothetical protein ABI266_00200 [Ginsengibacter sp.]